MIKQDLINLKNAGAYGVKIEFESEFYEENFAFELAEAIRRSELNLYIKLGGATSIQDLHLCKKLCANTIVAPMIESAYAVEKFLLCVEQVYGNNHPELLLNIETKNAFNNLDEIINQTNNEISGYVIGRSDLKNSLDIIDANDNKILNLCLKLSNICKNQNKKLIIGGKINSEALNFIQKIPYLTAIETRKVVFLKNQLTEECLKKSLEFELNLLKTKPNNFKEDLERIKFIEKSLNLKVYI